MGQADQSRAEWREATEFMRALVRFATADPESLAQPSRALAGIFKDVFIGPESLRRAFVHWGMTPVPYEVKLRRVNTPMLCSLQMDLLSDLDALAEATGVWRQVIPQVGGSTGPGGRKSFIAKVKLKSGREVPVDFTGAVVVLPEPVRQRIRRCLPRYDLTSIGRIEPVLHTASLRQLLYFGLAIALSRDVLLRSGKCRNCGTLVVHQQQPRPIRAMWFCTGTARDCKTAYHNAHKSRDAKAVAQRAWRRGERDRLQLQRDRAQTVGALSRFLVATESSPDSDRVRKTIRQLGAGGLQGWKMVQQFTKRIHGNESVETIWQSLSAKAKSTISEAWAPASRPTDRGKSPHRRRTRAL